MQALPLPLLVLVLSLLRYPTTVYADPATVPFTDCFDSDNTTQRVNVSTVYAQVLQNSEWGNYLNLTLLGDAPQSIQGLMHNAGGSLSTLFTTTSVLTLNAWTNSSFLCSTLRPPSPLPLTLDNVTDTYCPVPAGPFAFSASVPWGRDRALTTLITRLRAVDPSSTELLCIDVHTTPLDPSEKQGPYGDARLILWASVALAGAYWLLVGIARIVSAWGRGVTRTGRGLWGRLQSGGFILASAISGERLATSPALIRFCTPSLRDVIFHTQWCAALAMVAVQWPSFVYPLLSQTAWSTLSFNLTLVDRSHPYHWDPLSTLPYSPPSNFADQLSDPSSPLFIDPTIPNTLFTLPTNASDGISSFAYAVGVRPEDLFPNCLIIFLAIMAATIVLSVLLWVLDYFMVAVVFKSTSRPGYSTRARSPAFGASVSTRSALSKEPDVTMSPVPGEESKSLTGNSSMFGSRPIGTYRSWWRLRTDIGSFHGSVLHGNLVRILVLFHLPITIFSVYEMIQHTPLIVRTRTVLAVLSFAIFSVLIPLHLVLRVTFTTTNKLYDETRTLLSLGPLYNHYRHGSQMFAILLFANNIAFGVAIGAGQKSGTAQAIVILVVEVISALGTSIWLPWGSGASMGLISFLFCVARIVIAVLLVILTPVISIGPGPGGWVAYGILIILALVYLALLLMLLFKLIEAIVRILGGVGFDRSRRSHDAGLVGVLGLLGCCGLQPRSKKRGRKSKKAFTQQPSVNSPHLLPKKNSDVASFHSQTALGKPPSPRFVHHDTGRKISMNSGPPPSVLRPEHALPRPYREDDDDEGYIMSAWQSYPLRHGYVPVSEPTPTPTSTPPKSGFSKVGGGKSHIDTPYAIMDGTVSAFSPMTQANKSGQVIPSLPMHTFGNGSTHTFPSFKQNGSRSTLPRASLSTPGAPAKSNVFYEDEDPPPSLSSLTNVARQPEYGQLPPGAMSPAHVRTKSQTAIIEDASKLHGLAALTGIGNPGPNSAGPSGNNSNNSQSLAVNTGSAWSHPPPQFTVTGPDDDDDDDDDDDSTVEQQPAKKKPWYRIIRPATGPSPVPPLPPSQSMADSELGGLAASTSNATGAPSGAVGSSGDLSGSGTAAQQPTRSFVVIRKPQP